MPRPHLARDISSFVNKAVAGNCLPTATFYEVETHKVETLQKKRKERRLTAHQGSNLQRMYHGSKFKGYFGFKGHQSMKNRREARQKDNFIHVQRLFFFFYRQLQGHACATREFKYSFKA